MSKIAKETEFTAAERTKVCLSREALDGLRMTGS